MCAINAVCTKAAFKVAPRLLLLHKVPREGDANLIVLWTRGSNNKLE